MLCAKGRWFADSLRRFQGNGLVERNAVRLEMMMVEKRGKMGKGGFRFHMTGMRYGSIRLAIRFAGGTMCGRCVGRCGSIRLIGEWERLAVTAVP